MIQKNLLTACIAIVLFSSCKKSDPAPPTPLAITALSVNHGPEHTVVTITGTGFSATAANDHVYFNGMETPVTGATSTQLTTSVPPKARTGKITVKVGSGQVDGPVFTYDYSNATVTTLAGGPASSTFGVLTGIAVDSSGNVYVSDQPNGRVNIITPAGAVNAFSGTRQFTAPAGIAIDGTGNVYVVDETGARVWKLSPSGIATVLAGSATAGFADGTGAAAQFHQPFGITLDPSGNVYVADALNNRIRKITSAGVVTTIAGTGVEGDANGVALNGTLNSPFGIFSNNGALLISQSDGVIRKLVPGGDISTVAGLPFTGTTPFADGPAATARFDAATGMAIYDGNILVTDFANNRIRVISPAGNVTTVLGSATSGYADGDKTSCLLNGPIGITVDKNGNIYIAEAYNKAVRKVILE